MVTLKVSNIYAQHFWGLILKYCVKTASDLTIMIFILFSLFLAGSGLIVALH